jgi:hypothetical protein
MATATATIHFECADVAEAQTTVDGWTLSPGCSVYVNVNSTLDPHETDGSGNVVPVPDPDPEDIGK